MANLVGTYDISKANLIPAQSSDFHLIISKRQKASANKPKDYLLIYQAGRFQYLSSLYPASATDASLSASEAQIWHLDHQSVNYELILNRAENKAEIRRIAVNGQ